MPTGALTDTERYLFDLRGYVVRHDVLSAGEVAALLEAVEDLRLGPPGPAVLSQRFGDHLARAQPFRDLLDHPAVLDVVRELCGPFVRLDHAYGIVMDPGQAGLGWHGGGAPLDPAQTYLWRHGQMANGLVAVLWALVEHGPGDGGFGCIPASHKANLPLPADGWPADLVAEVELHPGSMVVFTEALTHATLPWRGDRRRVALVHKYAPGHLAWSRRTVLEDHPGLGALLTERQRHLVDGPSVAGRTPP